MEPVFGEEISYGNVQIHLGAWRLGEAGAAAAAADKGFFTIRVTEFKQLLLGGQTLVHGLEEFTFDFYMTNILHSPSLRRRTVSYMLSHLTSFYDPNPFSFWVDGICNFCHQAAVNIGRDSDRGGIQFVINIHLHTVELQLNSDHQLSSLAVEEEEEEFIDDVLALSGFLGRNEDEERGVGCGGVPASASAIDTLERLLKYDDGASSDGLFGQKDCTICFEDLETEGMDISRMPCSHIFHHKCLALWLVAESCLPSLQI